MTNRISASADILHGRPRIAGTRIMVSQVVDLLESGKTTDEIIRDYFPDITAEDVRACLAFARKLVDGEEIHVVEERAVA